MIKRKKQAFSFAEILISIFIFLIFIVFFMSFSSNYRYSIDYVENNLGLSYLLGDTSTFINSTGNLSPGVNYLYFSGSYILTGVEVNLNKFGEIAEIDDKIFKRKIVSQTGSLSFTSSTDKTLSGIIYKNDIFLQTSLCQTGYCINYKIIK